MFLILTRALWKLPSLTCGDSTLGPVSRLVRNFHEHPTTRVLRGNREDRWRCASTHVAIVNGSSPIDRVAHPNPGRLRLCP